MWESTNQSPRIQEKGISKILLERLIKRLTQPDSILMRLPVSADIFINIK